MPALSARPPRARGLPIIGNALGFMRNPPEFLLQSAREHGDVVDLDLPIGDVFLVSHPDLIEQVLVTDNRIYMKDTGTRGLRGLLGDGLLTSEGDHWRRQRRLAQPGFHRERVASYGAVMVEYTERMLDELRDGDERDIHDDMMRLTREIVAKTLFDADVTREADKLGRALSEIVTRFAEYPPGVPVLSGLPTPSLFRYRRAALTLDEMIYGLIQERRASGRDSGDLLSMLMAARDEEGEGRMSDRQLRDEAMTVFLAGHETTALTLWGTWLLLSQNPEAEARLAAELHDVLDGRAPSVSDLPKLRYTEQVIHESMRLYPPAWAIGRQAIDEGEVGGYRLRKGGQVWMSQWIMHRDPRYFDDPSAFRPERWANDFAKRIPKYAYFPFGGGPRLCIGVSFALMESTLLLAAIARRFKVIVDTARPVKTVAAVTLRPKHGIKVRLEKRS
jgi:cytochrome P450